MPSSYRNYQVAMTLRQPKGCVKRSSSTDEAGRSPATSVATMWYVGGFAIGICLIAAIVVVAAKAIRKR
jgi:hypothetical protein